MDNRPIGIFDSGLGGLTVVKEVMKALPHENIVYLGDTARVPYGTKSDQAIKRFSLENAEFLKKFNVKIIIVACNTASSIALPALRKKITVPVVGTIRPGAGKAIEATRNNRIGVIGTPMTIKSRAYEKEIKRLSKDKKVFSSPCSLFVQLVEEGWLGGRITLDIARKYLKPLAGKKIDTLILGCTHYPLLKNVISKAAGRGVRIVDSAGAVAEEVKGILGRAGKLAISRKKPSYKFFATDAVEQFARIGARFLGKKISNLRRADYV